MAVAEYLAKLMAYKDEYEVARLYSRPEFLTALRTEFEGEVRMHFHLAPPFLAPRDRSSNVPRKVTFGQWMLVAFNLLARLKVLRGTPFDPFGRSRERRLERSLIQQYRADVTAILETLSPATYESAIEIASYPEFIRGFGHVRDQHLKRAMERRGAALAKLKLITATASDQAEEGTVMSAC